MPVQDGLKDAPNPIGIRNDGCFERSIGHFFEKREPLMNSHSVAPDWRFGR
jgi:hypothetical protein